MLTFRLFLSRRLGLLRCFLVWPVACLLIVGTMAVESRAGGLRGGVNFEQTFGYNDKEPAKGFHVILAGTSSPYGVFWPGEDATFDFQILNNTDQPLKTGAHWEVIQYSTRSRQDDSFAPPILAKVKPAVSVPATIDIAAKGFVNQSVKLPIGAEFGAYAVVLEIDGQGRELAAACIRTMKPSPGKVQFPKYALDVGTRQAPMYQRIGVKGTRQEFGVIKPDDKDGWANFDANMKMLADNDITLMMTVSTGGDYSRMPLGKIRGFLNDKNEGNMNYPGDFAALPEYDQDFQNWMRTVLEKHGWPKGPVNAVELWNEPWEGMSISGWGADMPRYRELYTRMAQGVEEARKSSGVQVLIGGACSSMNTEDKFFSDGNDEPFLKWLDFTSIHYQPMCPQPVLIKRFAQRKHPNGPTRVWDTESWLANSEDRVAAMIASMRASGLDRTSGVFHDRVRDESDEWLRQEGAEQKRVYQLQPLAPAAAIAAVNEFIGQRNFKELLFKDGLPWIFVFEGADNKPEDGTVVVLGDLGGTYERNLLAYHGVLGFDARKRGIEARAKLAALPPDAPDYQRNELTNALMAAEVLDNAALTFTDSSGHVVPLDFFGNPIKPEGGKVVVPLNGYGYFLHTDGTPGSFAKLLDQLRQARIEGYEPVDIVAKDLLKRVDAKPALRISIANILNRPISGKLDVKLGKLQLDTVSQDLTIGPHETKDIELKVTGGSEADDNTYPLVATFDAGADGRKTHEELLHVNLFSRKTINVDGKLDDWKDVLPQPIRNGIGGGRNVTEKAWLPFVKFEEAAGQGYASGYMAYDDKNFYFAAKIADTKPYDGNIRFANRNDDEYFYPEVSYTQPDANGKREELHWPANVRRFSYRMTPPVPAGEDTENVQLGFNVLPLEKTDWLSHPPGTMPNFICTKSADYEYALNLVSQKAGGGTEIFRLAAPGLPRKHYYPREPKVPAPGKDGGPLTDGKLSITREGNTRIVECAIPWTEIPDVKAQLDAGQTVKYTFRVNENGSPSYELNQNRSVSKANSYALHNYWQSSWSVETEFAFEK